MSVLLPRHSDLQHAPLFTSSSVSLFEFTVKVAHIPAESHSTCTVFLQTEMFLFSVVTLVRFELFCRRKPKMLQLLPEATDRKRGRWVRGTRGAYGQFSDPFKPSTFCYVSDSLPLNSHYFSHKSTHFSRFVECFVKLLKISHLHKYSDYLLESICD